MKLPWCCASFIIVAALATSPPEATAAGAEDCLTAAFKLMAGEFTAEGRRLTADGDLETFSGTYSAVLDNDRSITFSAGRTKYGTWRLEGSEYQLITYDAAGTAAAALAIDFNCHISAPGTMRLYETWTAGVDSVKPGWLVSQYREVKDDRFTVTTMAREKGSTLPPVLLSQYAARQRN